MDLNLSVLPDCFLCLGSADMYVAHLCRERAACSLSTGWETLTDNAYIQETSINNSFVRERVFYHLNEQFIEPEI